MAREKQARQLAAEAGETHYYTGKPCKHGHVSVRRVKDRVCMACDRAYQKAVSQLKTPEEKAEAARKSYMTNREKNLASKKLYRANNKGKITALNTMRKRHIKQATPAWLSSDDKWLFKEIYDLAALRTKMHGFSWHVDHIIPIRGMTVCGLHIAENMQVIPWIDNIKKKNKYEVHYG